MAKPLPIASISVIVAVTPLAVATGDAAWTEVGRVGALTVSVAPDRYAFDPDDGRLSVAMRMDGDFDQLMAEIPEDAAAPATLRFGGIRRMEMDFVHDCREGQVSEVRLRAAYDDLGRRTPAPAGAVALLERSARDAMRAISTPAAREAVRRVCRTRGLGSLAPTPEDPATTLAAR